MREHCIAVTRFASDQPGFLDFSYRIKALAKAYRLTVISLEPLQQEELRIDGVEYIVFPFGQGRFGWIKYLYTCARLVRRDRPDRVVLLHSLLTPMLWLLRKIPVALYWNEHPSRFTALPPGHPFLKRLARRLSLKWAFYAAARRASLLMPIGEAHYHDLLAHACDPARVKLIHMGVCERFLRTAGNGGHGAHHAPVNLVYVGTVNQARGRDVMLEALALVNREQRIARLAIIGASEEELHYCGKRAVALGIAADISLSGRVCGTQVPAMLNGMDAGLCLWEDRPWWRFNPPTKLFEYLVAGLPVLASNICTHTQYITDGHNGIIFEYDAGSLANAIQRLWEMRNDLPMIRRNAFASGTQYLWREIEPVFLQAVAGMTARGHAATPKRACDSSMTGDLQKGPKGETA
ncbi:glycosyltransferase [Janthinobacterium sp. 17J80-10]|uniref:glycosyltransferase family 4 protein n=1 Tax=Janthinobacterium sp. 17J80-10 TaxID=2497863 RepID=UPI00100579D8|nr:glycosyltransferase [Janthinobacterium sp. 17J80-10]QAU32703.1 glycosyltransferase [Janthinobacterium sp. 17J80-10]